MSRSISFAAVLLFSAGVAWGHPQGEVRSYYFETVGGEVFYPVVPLVPKGGFVLTDVFVFHGLDTEATRRLEIREVDPGDPDSYTIKINWVHFGLTAHRSLGSGIYFQEGMQVSVRNLDDSGGQQYYTFNGYIPCRFPCRSRSFPAVSSAGVGVLVVLLVAGGGFVFNRRQRQAA